MNRPNRYTTKVAYTVKHMYESYVDYTSENNLKHIDYITFKRIVFDYFQYILDRLWRGLEFEMPARLGTIGVTKMKLNSAKSIDFHSTKQLGYTVWFTNDHSNGYKYKFRWSKIPTSLVNIKKYSLQLVRSNKRKLAQMIKNRGQDFIEL